MNLQEYKNEYQEFDSSPGWDSIDDALKKVYGDVEPAHFAPQLPASLGGDVPLDGISVYKSIGQDLEHLHFVTYGYSSLYYDEKSVGAEHSRFGFEMTFRLANCKYEVSEYSWAINFLNNISKYVFKTGNVFGCNHCFNAKGPVRIGFETEITAVAFCIDPELGEIATPHGLVQFIQAYGLTSNEYRLIKAEKVTVEELLKISIKNNRLLITDLQRRS